MDPAIAGLLGAFIGGGLALLKPLVDGWSNRKLEREKAAWVRDNTVATEFRSHIAAVAREVLSIQHSMEWLCSATDAGGELTPAVMANYHVEIHSATPKLLGALATVASIDESTYENLSKLADDVFDLDSKLAAALRGYLDSPSLTSQAVASLRAPITKLYKQLPKRIAAVMKSANQS
jgi:hypothetical protein